MPQSPFIPEGDEDIYEAAFRRPSKPMRQPGEPMKTPFFGAWRTIATALVDGPLTTAELYQTIGDALRMSASAARRKFAGPVYRMTATEVLLLRKGVYTLTDKGRPLLPKG